MRSMRSRFVLLLVLLLVLAACGGGDEPEETGDTRGETAVVEEQPAEEPTEAPAEPTEAPVEPTEPPAPTSTPIPEPTDVPVVESPAAGFDPFTSEEGGFSVSYPSGWFTSDLFGFATFASNEALLDSPDPGEEGGVALVVSGPTDEFEGDTNDPVALLNTAFVDFGIGEDATLTAGPTATTINGLPGATARFTATADESGEALSGLIAIVVDEALGRAAVFFGVTPSATEGEFLPTFEAMATTIVLMEAAEVTIPDLDLGGGGEAGGDVVNAGIVTYDAPVAGLVQNGAGTTFTFSAVAGDVIDVVVEPDEALDAVIEVRDAAGNSVNGGEVDDSFGTEEIRQLSIPALGDYTVFVRGFAESTGTFTLTVTRAGAAATGANVIAYGDFLEDSLASGEVDVWQFNGNAGDLVNLTVTPLDDNDLSQEEQFDITMNILDSSGLSIHGGIRDLSFDTEFLRQIELPAAGVYSIEVAGFESSDVGSYELSLEDARRGRPTTIVSASDSFDEGEGVDSGHRFPFTADSGEVVVFQAEPEFGLNVRVEVYNDDTDTILDEYSTNLTTGFEEVEFFVPADGNYYFELKLNEETDLTAGSYDATIVAPSTAQVELASGDTVFGETGTQGYVEYWLGVSAGQVVNIAAQTEDNIDLVIEVYDQDDNLLASIDDTLSGEAEALAYTAAEEAVVVIRISDFFEGEGKFEATIN